MPGPASRLLEWAAPARMGTAFRWNLASVWASNIGDGVALAAGPLLVASQTRSPALIAAAAIVQSAPSLLVGLYAGALADRLDRTVMTVVANAARVLVISVLVATILTDAISIAVVLASLALLGTAEVFADSASRTVLPMVVPRADLGIGNARLMSGFLVGNQLLGPPVGAALFGLGMAWPFGVQAVLTVYAAVLFVRMGLPRGGVRGAVQTHIWQDMRDGVRWLGAHPPVRTLALVIVAFNVTWGAAWSMLVLYSLDMLHMGAIGFGLLTTATAVGGIISTAGYDRIERRFSLATIMKACLTLEVLTHLALAVNRSEVGALAIMVVFGGYAFVWSTVSSTVRQRAVPTEYMGRIGGVYMVGLTAGLLVGQVIGGVLGSWLGVLAPIWFAFVGSALTLAVGWSRLDSIAHAGEA